MNERETDLIADEMKAPDLADVDLIVLAEAPRDVDHAGRHVEVERHAQLPEMRPLRQRLEMVHRFARFDFHDRLEPMPPFERLEDQVRKYQRRATADPRVLFAPRIDPGLVPAPVLGLQQANDTVVLELLTHRPDQDWAHLSASN